MRLDSRPGVPCQRAYGPLDVLGFNEYFGWYDAGGGSTDDRDALSPFLDSLRACYPTKGLIVSEFGFEGNRNGPVDERGTYQFQSNTAAFHLDVFASKPWLSGAIYWLLQDFAAVPGWGGGDPRPDPPFVQKGLVDFPAWRDGEDAYTFVRDALTKANEDLRRAAASLGLPTRSGTRSARLPPSASFMLKKGRPSCSPTS